MNTKLFLLLGTSLSFIPNLTSAQCVATQDCATLGYTENSCSGGNGVKCPFGNKWACFKSDSEVCEKYGFTQTCTDTGETGVGKPCNGKYSECKCKDGYIWNDSSQKCEYDYQTNCVIGALYYADGTCSQDKISSKTLLGVVIYEKSASQNGWIITHKPIATNIKWSTEYVNISGLPNYTSESKLTDIQASCTNTDAITAYGSSSKYPAAWAAKNYKPSGTPSGKSWCLPSGGLLNDSLDNSTNLTRINAGILTAGGTKLGYGEQPSDNTESVWSSSECNNNNAWYFNANTSGLSYMRNSNKAYRYFVRPVLAF